MVEIAISSLRISAAALMFCALAPSAEAQSFPSRPITLIFPFAGGSTADNFFRVLAPEAAKTLGQPVVVENRTGAAGRVGLTAVTNARGDGYLLTVVNNGMVVIQPLASATFKSEPVKDYAPVLLTYKFNQALFGNSALPFRDLKGLIGYAKTNPGKLNGGSSGTGGTGHLLIEMLNVQAGVNITHVPYKGQPLVLAALLSGEVHLLFDTAGPKPHVDAGKLFVVATSGQQRMEAFSDRPTFVESGLPDFTFVIWLGIVAPPGTPTEVVTRLNTAFNLALKSSEVAKRSAALGGEIIADSTPEQFAALIRADTGRLDPVIRRAGLKLD